MKIKLFFLLFLLSVQLITVGQKASFKKFKKLSGPEKCWVFFHPFVAKKALLISEKTREITKQIQREKQLKGNGSGGQVDAFRHALWMAQLTISIGGRRAMSLGEAHERGNYKSFKHGKTEDGVRPDKISSEMDLFNNEVGIEIGKISHASDLISLVIKAVKEGKCKMILQTEMGDFLDCEGSLIPFVELKGKWENEKCLVDSNR